MKMQDLNKLLQTNAYPGRGIVIGATPDGKHAAIAYFIMGRSENSRNRVFTATSDGVRTEAFDASKMSDPSLVIYNCVRVLGNKTIVSNGDQTDTIYEGLDKQKTFEESLQCREFEPDPPIYTPRISGIVRPCGDGFNYALSILKSADGNPDSCNRFLFTYKPAVKGVGHFIHTYNCDGNPPEVFSGEPTAVTIVNDINEFTQGIWQSLNEANKISLFTRFIDLKTGEYSDKIINKNVR
ncbi:MAG: IMP cyclohydrolase [Ruminococcus sp.]|nr:IMP cyclohydrolase [Ruminococcus sp.]